MKTVYFISLKARQGKNLLKKLRIGIESAYRENPFINKNDLVAIKIHFGELGNLAYIRPQYIKTISQFIEENEGKPFLTDTNTLYVGTRSTAPEHITTALVNGFGYLETGCPIIIADGLRGESKIKVKIDGETTTFASISQIIYEADCMLVLTHFKGHEISGFGGAIKNLGMGCASREGKLFQHSTISPSVSKKRCTGCGKCIKVCPAGAITTSDKMAKINPEKCIGCSECIVTCPEESIHVNWNESAPVVMKKMAEYAKAALMNKENKTLFINFITQVSPLCDCYGFNDSPVVPDIGICVATDPVAIDMASVELVNKAGGKDVFTSIHPDINYYIQLEHAQKMGLGQMKYRIKVIN